MTEHIFLTGRKQVGKSTLIRKVLNLYTESVGGFFTVRTDTVFPGRFSVHMLQAGTNSAPSKDNLLFLCGEKDGRTAERFDALGCAALGAGRSARLLIMDELGPAEAEALRFQKAVLQALDGEVPILGVLQEADSLFLQKAAAHPGVTILRVTEDNRDQVSLIEKVLEIISQNRS